MWIDNQRPLVASSVANAPPVPPFVAGFAGEQIRSNPRPGEAQTVFPKLSCASPPSSSHQSSSSDLAGSIPSSGDVNPIGHQLGSSPTGQSWSTKFRP
ncbi:hypothetical protein Droror1_Dr00011967 [Drosera rotundifolia]